MDKLESRRSFLTTLTIGIAGTTAGCISGVGVFGDSDDSVKADCTTEADPGGEILLDIAVLEGDEEIGIGVVVPYQVPGNDNMEAIVIQDRNEDIVADIPLRGNRDSSDVDPDISREITVDGELYTFLIGRPPQHGVLDFQVINPEGDVLDSAKFRFNCYSSDGEIP